ncbi:glycosyltransferase [Leeuwenhoekiella sp. NPDC079379]|uniref:glycosyltransferase n=1 Tax=Leeuwenhoekiella sp. NPDC079379 TaxID=3364122 RepID=UPI0037C99E98
MRVLLVHKFHKYTGGADVFYLEVGRVLKDHGHDVAYFSTIDSDTLDNAYKDYFVKAPDFKTGGILGQVKAFLKIPYNFEAKKAIGRLLDDFNPDIVHAFGVITQLSPSVFDAVSSRNIPLVVSLNDYKHICPNYKLFHHGHLCEDCKGGTFYKAITNKCSHNSLKFSIASSLESYIHNFLDIYKKNIDLFLFASDFMAHKTEDFWGYNTFNWGKLKNPFKISTRAIEQNKDDYGLYFGRLIEEKGVDLILKALVDNKDIPFKIIGNGPELEPLKNLAIQLNLSNVEFLGAKWGDELEDILYKAKFTVVPSVWHENFPYVILQSFAAEVPVLGSNLGGIPELVSNERGLLFDVNRINSLSSAIRELYDNNLLRKKMGENAREFVLYNFNDTSFYKEILLNYESVLK